MSLLVKPQSFQWFLVLLTVCLGIFLEVMQLLLLFFVLNTPRTTGGEFPTIVGSLAALMGDKMQPLGTP